MGPLTLAAQDGAMFTGSYEARDGRAMGVAVFLPSAVAVTPRSTIGFPNSDPVLHNIFLVDDPRVRTDLGTYPGGEDDNNGRKDVYAKIRHKWGGMRLVGEEPTLTHAHPRSRVAPTDTAPWARTCAYCEVLSTLAWGRSPGMTLIPGAPVQRSRCAASSGRASTSSGPGSRPR